MHGSMHMEDITAYNYVFKIATAKVLLTWVPQQPIIHTIYGGGLRWLQIKPAKKHAQSGHYS